MNYAIVFALLGASMLGFCFITGEPAGRIAAAYVAFGFFGYAIAYALRQPGFLLKRRDGSVHAVSYVLFAPLHLLSWFSLLVAIRLEQEEPFQEISPNVLLGRRLLPREAATLPAHKEIAVLDLTCEFAESRQLRTPDYLCLPVLDHTSPTLEQVRQALAFVDEHVSRKSVFVHCALGRGRSATIVAAWLLNHHLAPDVRTVMELLKTRRRGVNLEAGQIKLLEEMFPGQTNA
jgi:protein-tyrosine phosphatase